MLPVDIVALVAVIMGISIVLIPVAGLTARYALKPIVEALGRYFEGKGEVESAKIAERRLLLVEQQLDEVQDTLNHLVESAEFDARLRTGRSAPALPDAPPQDSDRPEAGY